MKMKNFHHAAERSKMISFLLLGSTVKKRERLSSKAVCAMVLIFGGLKTTDSVARMPSAVLRRPYTAQPSIPGSMVTSCACVSTWMAWTVELENTLLCLFTWCRAIMIASLSGHLPEGSPSPSWINPMAANFVSTSASHLLPSPTCCPFSGQQLHATTRAMATWSLLRSSTSAIHSTLKTIPCWFAFRLIIDEAFAPIPQLWPQARVWSDLRGWTPYDRNSSVGNNGYVEFAPIEHIRDPQYIKNNTMLVRIQIDHWRSIRSNSATMASSAGVVRFAWLDAIWS